MNKKGLELVWSTVVVIIIALVLLAFLLLFFVNSSSSFTSTIKGYFSHSNVDSIVQSCNILADTNSQYSFCCEKKSVKYYDDGDKTQNDFTCDELSDRNFVSNLNSLNCNEVSC